MPEFNLVANVEQVVKREIHLTVVADTKEQAEAYGAEALLEYPKPVVVPGVNRILVRQQEFKEPKRIAFLQPEPEGKKVA